jgi:hypothetical protein
MADVFFSPFGSGTPPNGSQPRIGSQTFTDLGCWRQRYIHRSRRFHQGRGSADLTIRAANAAYVQTKLRASHDAQVAITNSRAKDLQANDDTAAA